MQVSADVYAPSDRPYRGLPEVDYLTGITDQRLFDGAEDLNFTAYGVSDRHRTLARVRARGVS